MTKAPNRVRDVFFLGAGFSKSMGLPNTAELLGCLCENPKMEKRVVDALRYFYPEYREGFRPEVVDFFSLLSAYLGFGRRLPEGFSDHGLLRDMRMAIAQLLIERARQSGLDGEAVSKHARLSEMIQPGNVIVTSNWDMLAEQAALEAGLKYRYVKDNTINSELTILKLHGSINWVQRPAMKRGRSKHDYAELSERQGDGTNLRALKTDVDDKHVVAVRITDMGRTWQRISARSSDPYLATMTPGKADVLDPLQNVWDAAYYALSAAQRLTVVGYSMPHDDVEVRALLRAGVRRGVARPMVTVVNPDPSVHRRFRAMITNDLVSDYSAFPALT